MIVNVEPDSPPNVVGDTSVTLVPFVTKVYVGLSAVIDSTPDSAVALRVKV